MPLHGLSTTTTTQERWTAAPADSRRSDVHLTLPARPENVAVVRHVMGAFGDVLGLPEKTLADIRLAVTEACTNVVRHAYDEEEPGGRIEVAVSPLPDAIRIVVADTGRGIAPSTDRGGPGLGLPMIAHLADAMEIDRTVHAGSRLSMTFRRPSASAA